MPDISDELAELFDLDFGHFADDLPFYENMARRCEGPCLELGVGTGRVAVSLARADFEVWGIDSSEAMLARARVHAGPELAERLLPGDMREFDLRRQFDLIFAGLGAFHHLLTPDDQTACLRCVERHLAPGGLFVCDLRPLFHYEWEAGDSVPLSHEWTRVLPGSGQTVMKFRSATVDRARQVRHETHIFDRLSADGTVRRLVAPIDLRFTSRYEMEGLLRDAGLAPDQVYGDFDLAPYDDMSEYMITVARKRSEE